MLFGLNYAAKQYDTAMDWTNPLVTAFARKLAGAGSYTTSRICNLFDGLSERFRYLADPDMNLGPYSFSWDFVPAASEMIATGIYGDCEDIAILTAACIKALGGSPRIVIARTVVNGEQSGHAYCEVFAGDEDNVRQNVLPALARRYPRARSIFGHFDPAGGIWISMDGTAWPGGFMTRSDLEIAMYPGRAMDKIDQSGGSINLNWFLPESDLSNVRPVEVYGSDPSLAIKRQDPMDCDPTSPLRRYLSLDGIGLWVPNYKEIEFLRYVVTYARLSVSDAYRYAGLSSLEPPDALKECIRPILLFTGYAGAMQTCDQFKACLLGYIMSQWLHAPEPGIVELPPEPPIPPVPPSPEPPAPPGPYIPPDEPIHHHPPYEVPVVAKTADMPVLWVGLAVIALVSL